MLFFKSEGRQNEKKLEYVGTWKTDNNMSNNMSNIK